MLTRVREILILQQCTYRQWFLLSIANEQMPVFLYTFFFEGVGVVCILKCIVVTVIHSFSDFVNSLCSPLFRLFLPLSSFISNQIKVLLIDTSGL